MGHNLFGIGIGELIFLAVLALIVLGPKRLPEVARTVGRLVQQFRQVVDAAQEEARWLMGEVPPQLGQEAGPPSSVWPGSQAAVLNSPRTLLPGQSDGAPSPPAGRSPEQDPGRGPWPLESAASPTEQAAEEEPAPPFSPLAG